jgi:hypothetical protein
MFDRVYHRLLCGQSCGKSHSERLRSLLYASSIVFHTVLLSRIPELSSSSSISLALFPLNLFLSISCTELTSLVVHRPDCGGLLTHLETVSTNVNQVALQLGSPWLILSPSDAVVTVVVQFEVASNSGSLLGPSAAKTFKI